MFAFLLIAYEINIEWLFTSDGEGKESRFFIFRNTILLSNWCFYVVMYLNLVNTISSWICENINCNLLEVVLCFLEYFCFSVRCYNTHKSTAGTACFRECVFIMQETSQNGGPPGSKLPSKPAFSSTYNIQWCHLMGGRKVLLDNHMERNRLHWKFLSMNGEHEVAIMLK